MTNLKLGKISDPEPWDVVQEILHSLAETGRISSSELNVWDNTDEVIFQVKDALAGKGYKEFSLLVHSS